MTKRKSVLQVISAITLINLVSCSSDKSTLSQTNEGESNLNLAFTQSTPGLLASTDSISIKITGDNITTIDIGKKVSSITDTVSINSIPNGINREINAQFFDSKKHLIYHGHLLTNMLGGTMPIQIPLTPDFASLKINVPINIQNQNEFSSGKATLIKGQDTIYTSLSTSGLIRSFNVSPLFLGNYQMKVTLNDQSNKPIYSLDTNINISANKEFQLQFALKALVSNPQISFLSVEEYNAQINLQFPGSTARTPTKLNDLIFTELLPNPKTSGDKWEWIELYNSSNDTLNLKGCSIAKNTSSATSSSNLNIDQDAIIQPHQFYIFGRENVSFANYKYTGLTLSNSGQSILLHCNKVVIDSLEYKDVSDSLNPFPLYAGKSIQLNPDSIFTRNKGSSWCNTSKNFTSDSLSQYSSPHSLDSCVN